MNNEADKIDIKLVLPNGERYDIPKEGSLGILALGYQGVKAWREVRDREKNQKQVHG
ncbi:MAG: hypothetical protein SFW35_06870 [Chitinophagales bacterium]|nr:hypothetical protein [Chitinophagales bacterium]